jgi:hypothetical protein
MQDGATRGRVFAAPAAMEGKYFTCRVKKA